MRNALTYQVVNHVAVVGNRIEVECFATRTLGSLSQIRFPRLMLVEETK